MKVSVISNARFYGVRMRVAGKQLDANVSGDMIGVGQKAIALARVLSSGPFGNPRLLRQMGHPYARRAPHPPAPAYVINRNTGRFYAGWYYTWRSNMELAGGGQAITVSLRNDSQEARFLTAAGTSKMIGRPILDEIARQMQPIQDTACKTAMDKALKQALAPLADGATGAVPLGDSGSNAFLSFGLGFGLGFGAGTALGNIGSIG